MSGYEIAKKMRGLHEVKDNKKIKDFLADHGKDIAINPATTAWCAAIMNAWERAAGNKGNGKLNARSFLTYGTKVDSYKNAKPGDIVIFSRGGSTWMGHVAYYDDIEFSNGRTLIRTVGGNQSDSVSTGWYGVDRLIGIRRP